MDLLLALAIATLAVEIAALALDFLAWCHPSAAPERVPPNALKERQEDDDGLAFALGFLAVAILNGRAARRETGAISN